MSFCNLKAAKSNAPVCECVIIARSLMILAEFGPLVFTCMDRPFIDKTLDSGSVQVILSTQVFMLTSK